MKNKPLLELYIHIPFCARKCEYCDFLSGVAPWSVQRTYVDQLIEEIICLSERYPGYQVPTIFIGGGTPSILTGRWIGEIMEAVTSHFEIADEPEITIEANPGTLNQEKLEQYRKAGINRLSIGLQSAEDAELKKLGRIHIFDDFLKSYERARQAGFHNINIDLMSALPGQTLNQWKSTLRKAAMLKPEHISAYSLIIEEGTPFYEKYHNHTELLPDEDTERDMYHMTQDFLQQQGYGQYEISNFSRAGYECRHNTGYWNGTEYLGIGLGASSFVGGFRYHNVSDLKTYLELDMHCSNITDMLYCDMHELEQREKIEEFMFLGLRMTKGISGSEFMEKFCQNMWNVYADVLPKLVEQGLIEVESPYIRLTRRGIDVSNYVMSRFLFS